MSLGINCKWIDPGMIGMVWGILVLNLLVFFTTLFVLEVRRQLELSKTDPFVISTTKWTQE